MKQIMGILFFYTLLVVLLLPLAVTLLCGGFGTALPQEAKGSYNEVHTDDTAYCSDKTE